MKNTEGFAVVPRSMLHDGAVAPYVKLTFTCLTSYANGAAGGTCWPSHRELAECVGVSETTVKRALRWLRDQGWITISVQKAEGKPQGSNRYTLHMPPLGPPGT